MHEQSLANSHRRYMLALGPRLERPGPPTLLQQAFRHEPVLADQITCTLHGGYSGHSPITLSRLRPDDSERVAG